MDEIRSNFDAFSNVADAIGELPETVRGTKLIETLHKLYNSFKNTATNYMPSLGSDEQADVSDLIQFADDVISEYPLSDNNEPVINKEGTVVEHPVEKEDTSPKGRNIDAEINALTRQIDHLEAQDHELRNSFSDFDPTIYNIDPDDLIAYEKDPVNFTKNTGKMVHRKELQEALEDKRNTELKNKQVDRSIMQVHNKLRTLINQRNDLIAERDGKKPEDEYTQNKIGKIEKYLDSLRPNNYDYTGDPSGYTWDPKDKGLRRARYDMNGKIIGQDTFWSMTDDNNNSVLARAYNMLMDYFSTHGGKGARDKFINDPGKFKITPEMVSDMTNGKVDTTTDPRLYYALLRYPDIINLSNLKAKIHRDAEFATNEIRRLDMEKGDKKARFYYKYPDEFRNLLNKVDTALERVKSIRVTDEAVQFASNSNVLNNYKNTYINRKGFDFNALKGNTRLISDTMHKQGSIPYDMMKDYLDAGKGTNAEDFPPPNNTKIDLIIHANDYDLARDAVWCSVTVYNPDTKHEENYSEIGKSPEFGWHDTTGWSNRAKEGVEGANNKILRNLDKAAESSTETPWLTQMGEPYKETPSSEYGSAGNLELGIEDPNVPEATDTEATTEAVDKGPTLMPESWRTKGVIGDQDIRAKRAAFDAWDRGNDLGKIGNPRRNKVITPGLQKLITKAEVDKDIADAKTADDQRFVDRIRGSRPIKTVYGHDPNEESEQAPEPESHDVFDDVIPPSTRMVKAVHGGKKKVDKSNK